MPESKTSTRKLALIASALGLAYLCFLTSQRVNEIPAKKTGDAPKLAQPTTAKSVASALSSTDSAPAHPSRAMDQDSTTVMNVPTAVPTGSGKAKKVVLGPREKAAFTGEEATATVHVGDTEYDLSPNQIKMFPRIDGLQPGQTLPVTVSYPQGNEGDPVVVEAQDGGIFDNKKPLRINQLDGAKTLAFAFTTGQQEGVYRIILRKGGDQKTLDFWVGQQAPLKN